MNESGFESVIKSQSMAKIAATLDPGEREYFYSINKYLKLAHEDYKAWIFEPDACLSWRGRWREHFGLEAKKYLDLEIGTGNGYFFEHRLRTHKDRALLGIELKYKPIVQTVKRCLFTRDSGFRLLRLDASYLEKFFAPEELNEVFIYFPDPWDKRREQKHRLLQVDFLQSLYELQRVGSSIWFKTDSESYFEWVQRQLKETKYFVAVVEPDFQNSPHAQGNFATHFERLWTRKGRQTYFLRVSKLV